MNIAKKELKRVVGILSKVTDKNYYVPVLGYVRIQGAAFEATDLEQNVTIQVACDDADRKPYLVPFTALKNAVKGVAKGNVAIKPVDDNKVMIAVNGVEVVVDTLMDSEWPEYQGMPNILSKIDLGQFLSAYRDVLPAVSRDSARYTLVGVFFEGNRLVATDGKRLISREIDFVGNIPCILRNTSFLKSVKMDGIGEVGYDAGSFVFRVRIDGLDYCTQCIDGQYPNYRQVIPSQEDRIKVTFSEGDMGLMKTAFDQFEDNEYHSVKISSDGSVAVISSANGGKVQLSASVNGEFELGLNWRYLWDSLMAGCREMFVVDGIMPMLLVGDGVVSALMPVRIEY